MSVRIAKESICLEDCLAAEQRTIIYINQINPLLNCLKKEQLYALEEKIFNNYFNDPVNYFFGIYLLDIVHTHIQKPS